jgi:acyl carrier protein
MLTRFVQEFAMLESSEGELRRRVERLVREILERNSIGPSVALGDVLVDIGLSSIDLVNLMLAVEAEFDLTIPQSELTVQNFRSITTIIRLVGRLREKTPAS